MSPRLPFARRAQARTRGALGLATLVGLLLLARDARATVPETPGAALERDLASSAVQLDAPSISTASPELLDRGDFPALGGVAWDQRLGDIQNRHGLTLNLTPLALARAVRGVVGEADDVPRPELWRRAAFRVTVGGPLQFVDSLRAGRAGRPTDHVTSELKLRLLEGRRDSPNPTTVALALDADNLSTGFGLDRYLATLIAERQARCAWTVNAGYRVTERYRTARRLAETKLGLGLGLAQRGPFDLDLSGACLLRNHGRAAVWQGGARFEVRVREGLRLSFAARQSAHTEMRGDARRRGVISLAYAL